ncbi:MAG TPA: class I SAM-dependent methyltransferase [Candidatus Polarisedimenticolaceae bacterium]|nr:class I SAM-dependent methyltransferase [Candidatus Polarisedimenticolaceae bacterium]
MRPYDAIAHRYDAHGWDWYAATTGERLLELLAERGVAPGSRILDAGCGTGTLALLLAGAGYEVTGVDLSSSMIERARKKDTKQRVDWRVGDITELELDARFDAIVTVADVLNHLSDLDRWEAAFRSFHRLLRPGGLLFADVMTAHGLSQMDQQSVQERGGVTLILSIVWEPRERRSTLKVTSFAPAPSDPARYERTSETISEWAFPIADVLERAARAGFSSLERVWGIESEAENDDRLTILARTRTSTP